LAWNIPQGARLREQAQKLGVSVDDLLTTDGQELGCEALRDIKTTIGGVSVDFKKGDRIRNWHQIDELRKGGSSDIASLESELQRRVLMAREYRRHAWLWLLALVSAIASRMSAGAAWFAVIRHR
jgi:hypothetical protein